MKKKLFNNIFLGALKGVAIMNIVAIILSAFFGEGKFYLVSERLIGAFNSEIWAVGFQFFTVLIVGGIIGGLSILFQMENISILKTTIIHFGITFISVYLVAYLNFWINRDLVSSFFSNLGLLLFAWWPNSSALYQPRYDYGSLIVYLSVFIVIYLVYWIVNYLIYKRKLKKLNKALFDKKNKI